MGIFAFSSDAEVALRKYLLCFTELQETNAMSGHLSSFYLARCFRTLSKNVKEHQPKSVGSWLYEPQQYTRLVQKTASGQVSYRLLLSLVTVNSFPSEE